MFTLVVIEESLGDSKIFQTLRSYFVNQRISEEPEDEHPIWHVNEYSVPEDELLSVLNPLKDVIKSTWYAHAFNQEKLYVVLSRKVFQVPLKRDETWDKMIEYDVNCAGVERKYLETIPLHA